MGYWYCKAEMEEEVHEVILPAHSFWRPAIIKTKTVTRIIEGRVLGVANSGYSGDALLIVTKEGPNPIIVKVKSPDYSIGKFSNVIELSWVKE